jgi:uncharacterized membrane protein
MKNTSSVSRKTGMSDGLSTRTRRLVETALLVAVTLVMGLTPYGTIKTPLLSISLVTVPVAIAAMLIGPYAGLICGTAFGLTSFLNALIGASAMMSALMLVNPLGVFVTCVIARMLDAAVTGFLFHIFHDVLKLKKLSYYLGGLVCPVFNTIFFMGSLILFFYGSDYVQNLAVKVGAKNPFAFVITIVGVQGLIEALAGMIVAGTVSMVLTKALKRA